MLDAMPSQRRDDEWSTLGVEPLFRRRGDLFVREGGEFSEAFGGVSQHRVTGLLVQIAPTLERLQVTFFGQPPHHGQHGRIADQARELLVIGKQVTQAGLNPALPLVRIVAGQIGFGYKAFDVDMSQVATTPRFGRSVRFGRRGP